MTVLEVEQQSDNSGVKLQKKLFKRYTLLPYFNVLLLYNQ